MGGGGINHPLNNKQGNSLKIYPVVLNQLLQISLRNIQGYQNILFRERKQWTPTLQLKGAIATWVTFDEPQRAVWKGAFSKGYGCKVPVSVTILRRQSHDDGDDGCQSSGWGRPDDRRIAQGCRDGAAVRSAYCSRRGPKTRIHARQLTTVRSKGNVNPPNSKAVRYPEMDSIWTMGDFGQLNNRQRSSGTCEAGPPLSVLLSCSYLGKLGYKRNR